MQSGAPLALLATDPDVSSEISSAAREWLNSVTYGLWQISDPEPGPGLWLTDIVTGVRRYAAIPPEQLPGMSRWSVLLGALVSLDGIWRSTGAVVLLRPSEGDGAAEWVHDASAAIAQAVAGTRGRRPGRRREPEPHGVLVALAEPLDPEIAALMSTVLGSLLPGIAGEVWRRRAAGPKLTNTDGHPPTADHRPRGGERSRSRGTDAGRARGLPDRGRRRAELVGPRADRHSSARARSRRSARSRTKASRSRSPTSRSAGCAGGSSHARTASRVSVNSEERLQALVQLLRGLGAAPEIGRRSVIDPAQDMPPIQLGMPMPFGASQDAVDAWQSLWPDERVPALGGATPRTASRRAQSRPRLEAVLREFEHDAYVLARAHRPAPDLERLRAELGMARGWEPSARAQRQTEIG